jgi:hypothetical protein
MARIRSVHPGLWTDEAFVSVSPTARLLAIGIWNECDDQGAFEWKPLGLKMKLMPADNVDVASLLAELAGADIIGQYEVDGRKYGAVRNFGRWQRPKKPNSIYPMPVEWRKYAATDNPSSEFVESQDERSSENRRDQPEEVPHQFPTSSPPVSTKAENSPQMEDGGGRREEEKKEPSLRSGGAREARPTVRGMRLPPDWKPSADDVEFATGLGLDAVKVSDVFRDYWHAKAGQDGAKRDWSATYRNWCRRDAESGKNGRKSGGLDGVDAPMTAEQRAAAEQWARIMARWSADGCPGACRPPTRQAWLSGEASNRELWLDYPRLGPAIFRPNLVISGEAQCVRS